MTLNYLIVHWNLDDVNVLSDVVESDDDINPNSVICRDELINTLPVNVSKLPAFALTKKL